VKASSEDLISSLIDDKFFIKLTNGAASFIDIIGEIIEAMGGMKGLLPLLVVGFTKLFGDKMVVGIRNFSQSLKNTNAAAQEAYVKMKEQALSSGGSSLEKGEFKL